MKGKQLYQEELTSDDFYHFVFRDMETYGFPAYIASGHDIKEQRTHLPYSSGELSGMGDIFDDQHEKMVDIGTA